jgi:hypothetical protein
MRSKLTWKLFLLVGFSVLFFGVSLPALHSQGETNQTEASLNDAKKKLTEMDQDMIVITKKIPKQDKKEGSPGGPPSKDKMIGQEVRQRLDWLKVTRDQLQERITQAEHARNAAEAQVFAKDALLKADTAESLKRSIVGSPEPTQVGGHVTGGTTQASESRAATGAEGKSRISFRSGALEQLEIVNSRSREAASKKDPDRVRQRATEAFGAGQAGAGGVALYKAASMLTPLETSRMTKALVENGRLVLVYGGQKLRFPQLDPEFLSLAIRSVYGGEGLVRGTVLANEENAIVLSTGKDQYGDVVWKKEFLPEIPKSLAVGQEIALELGPGVGVLSLPDPSSDRITYYGPLTGNVLGRVLQESDMVFPMVWHGVDWKTGSTLDPAKVDGYVSSIDLALSGIVPPAPKPVEKQDKPEPWWDDTVWFVWVPSEISLKVSEVGGDFEFVKTTMRVAVWSVKEQNVSSHSKAEGEYLTQHYDDYCRAFPALAQLRDAAKAVAIVRWLKQSKVPLDVAWAKNYHRTSTETPEKIRRFSVYFYPDSDGKPLLEDQ